MGRPTYDQATKTRVLTAHAAGKSPAQIAQEPGNPAESTIREWLNAAGQPAHGRSRRPYSPEERARIIAEYQAGASMNQLSKRPGYPTDTTIAKWLSAEGIPLRPEAFDPRGRFTAEEKEWAVSAYLAGWSARTIGGVLGCSNTTVLKWVGRAGHQARSTGERVEEPPGELVRMAPMDDEDDDDGDEEFLDMVMVRVGGVTRFVPRSAVRRVDTPLRRGA